MRGGQRIGSGRKTTKITQKKGDEVDELWQEGREAFKKAVREGDRTLLGLLFQAKFLKERVEEGKSIEDYVKLFQKTNTGTKELPRELHQDKD